MYTQLEALNFLLSQVGAAPVSTTANPLPDLASAQLRMYEAMVWVQKKGWWFNRLLRQEGVPDETTHEIDLPENTLKIITAYPTFLIARENKVFSPLYNTYEINLPIEMDIILLLDWESIPGSAQDAVMYRAASTMVLHELEDTNKAGQLTDEFNAAYVLLKEEDLQIKQRHTYSSPAIQRFMSRIRPYKRRSGTYNPIWPGGKIP